MTLRKRSDVSVGLKPIQNSIPIKERDESWEKAQNHDAVQVLHRRYERKPERLANLEKARADDHVGRKINAPRTEAGLTQRQLAKLVGTTASVICRLENADYEGHSLVMLNRIAAAMKCRVEIRFVPEEGRARSA